jgi:3-hydroxypropanoate dehydrogenase
MNDHTAAASGILPDAALDQLFRAARSHSVLRPPVSDAELRAIYELTKCGPTTSNTQPQRILFLRSPAAKERLRPALSSANRDKTMAAPVTAILAYDVRYYEHLPRMFDDPRARSWYEGTPHQETTALRNASLQGAYFILAARALGLDCGPMSAFDNGKVDNEFFPDGRWKSNFLCNLGRGDPAQLPRALARFAFDEVCRII